jgi:hypothetical protein
MAHTERSTKCTHFIFGKQFYPKRYFQDIFTKLFVYINGQFGSPNFFEIYQVFLCQILISYDVFNPGIQVVLHMLALNFQGIFGSFS